MTAITHSRRKTAPPCEEKYLSGLREYITDGSETARGKAYELGRLFLADGISLIELSAVHHAALSEIMKTIPGKTAYDELMRASEFLSESLSPYEMAHRGFQEAVDALRRMNELLEQEIKRVAYAVHDEAGQILVAVHLALADVGRAAPGAEQHLQRISALLKQVEVQLRQFSHELRPAVLDDLGLVPAIQLLASAVSKRANLPIQVSAELAERLSSCAEVAIYRVVQEALTNATKHSQARSVSIGLCCQDSMVHCVIQDDGVGFSPGILNQKGQRCGLGLVAMKERFNAIGGTISIESAPKQGTTIRLVLAKNAGKERDAHSFSVGR
jgi:signal transduction histidine kinase